MNSAVWSSPVYSSIDSPAAVRLQAVHIVAVHLEGGRLLCDTALAARLERWPAHVTTLFSQRVIDVSADIAWHMLSRNAWV